MGSQMGNHATDGNRVMPNPASPLYQGSLSWPGKPPMGNDVAVNTVCGVGGSRNLYGKSGVQGQHGPVNPGEARAPARGFDDRGTVKKV
jgi:hypothetical protein